MLTFSAGLIPVEVQMTFIILNDGCSCVSSAGLAVTGVTVCWEQLANVTGDGGGGGRGEEKVVKLSQLLFGYSYCSEASSQRTSPPLPPL